MVVQKSELASKLQKIRGVVPTRSQIESLRGVLLKDNMLYANNMEMAMSAKLDTNSDETFIIPQKAIDLIMVLPDGDISISCSGKNTLTIKADKIRNQFQTHSVDDFPPLPYIEDEADQNVGIEGETLQKALSSVIYAVPASSSKPQMAGVFLDSSDGILNLVGCDGFRIAWAKEKYPIDLQVIIPRDSVQRILQLGVRGQVRIKMNKHSAMFELEDFAIYTRLLEGAYLDYKKAYPTVSNTTIVERQVIVDSINRASICTDDKSKPQIVFDIEGDTLNISTTSSLSDYSEQITLETPIQDAIKIGFNGKYLLECFKTYDCTHLELGFGSSTTPMVVGDDTLKSLVLPVRLK